MSRKMLAQFTRPALVSTVKQALEAVEGKETEFPDMTACILATVQPKKLAIRMLHAMWIVARIEQQGLLLKDILRAIVWQASETNEQQIELQFVAPISHTTEGGTLERKDLCIDIPDTGMESRRIRD